MQTHRNWAFSLWIGHFYGYISATFKASKVAPEGFSCVLFYSPGKDVFCLWLFSYSSGVHVDNILRFYWPDNLDQMKISLFDHTWMTYLNYWDTLHTISLKADFFVTCSFGKTSSRIGCLCKSFLTVRCWWRHGAWKLQERSRRKNRWHWSSGQSWALHMIRAAH